MAMPGMDLWPFDVRRFSALQAQPRYLEERAIEAYGAYYKIHWPGEEAQAGARTCGARRCMTALRQAGAVFGSKMGWERPNWFAPQGAAPVDRPSLRGQAELVRCAWRRNIAPSATRAALIDQTSFAKFEIAGPGAEAALQRIAANDLSGPPGKAVYTQLCNERGGIEADVTLVHDGRRPFLCWSPAPASACATPAGLRSHLPDGVTIREVTNSLAVINLCGPRARDILQAVTDDDVSNAAFPFLAARRIDVGLRPRACRAHRLCRRTGL